MMPGANVRDLQKSLEDALDLLQDYNSGQLLPNRSIEPLPSLLEQCEALCSRVPDPEPVRSLHHFACTGGTVIAKSVALMPNVTLLSEIDPLSTLALPKEGQITFAPSDIIYAARTALRPVDEQIVERMFDDTIETLHQALCQKGRHLVLRDHTHSHFCTDVDFDKRPTLREQLLRHHPVRSVITVRHPLDSYLSLQANGWMHFEPGDLQHYCQRYRAFLDRYPDIRIFLYEDFIHDPETVLQDICSELELPYVPGTVDLLSAVTMSGDSGRKSNRIGKRPRRAVPEALQAEAANSSDYTDLCRTLGYAPDTH